MDCRSDEIIYQSEDEYGSDEESEHTSDTDMEYDTNIEGEEVDDLVEQQDMDLDDLMEQRTIRDGDSVEEDLHIDIQGDDEDSTQEQSEEESDNEDEDSQDDGIRRSGRIRKKPRPYYAESHIPVETILQPKDPKTFEIRSMRRMKLH